MARELVISAPGPLEVRKLDWSQEEQILELLLQVELPTPLFLPHYWAGLKSVRLVGYGFRWVVRGEIGVEREGKLFLLSIQADSTKSDFVFEQPDGWLKDVKFVW